jgi:[ribosomal protein S18]-alanine N-acetyltransferase
MSSSYRHFEKGLHTESRSVNETLRCERISATLEAQSTPIASAKMHIRFATFLDVQAIAALSRTEIEYGLAWSWTPDRVGQAIRDPYTNVIVATDPDSAQLPIKGFGIMSYRDETAHLKLLDVAPHARRRGTGRAMLVWLEKVAQTAGITTLSLEARQNNLAAIAMYRCHGYLQVRTIAGMYQGLDTGIRMEKRHRIIS